MAGWWAEHGGKEAAGDAADRRDETDGTDDAGGIRETAVLKEGLIS
jgi:hypothetical protein